MLGFLKKAAVSEETINYMRQNFSKTNIITLSDNEEECLKNIYLLKSFKIMNIEDLLRYETYIFFKSADRVYYELSKHNIAKVVEEVNEDFAAIEKYI